MIPASDALVRYYADASDEELREARRLGPGAFRPEAWHVIQSELGRRQLPRERGRARKFARGVAAARTREARAARRAQWTPGLVVGLVPAALAVIVTVRTMERAHIGPSGPSGGRALAGILVTLFVTVWFGVALLVDWRRWWPK